MKRVTTVYYSSEVSLLKKMCLLGIEYFEFDHDGRSSCMHINMTLDIKVTKSHSEIANIMAEH